MKINYYRLITTRKKNWLTSYLFIFCWLNNSSYFMNQMVVFIYIYEENSYFLQVCIPFYYIMSCQVRRFSNRSTHVLRKGDLCRIGKGTLTRRNHTFILPKKLSFIVLYAYMFNFRRTKTFLCSPLRSFKFQCTCIELLLLFPQRPNSGT